MLKSDFDLVGGQQFTVKVSKTPTGSYEASVPTVKDLGTFSGDTQTRAIQQANDALNKYVTNNYQVKK